MPYVIAAPCVADYSCVEVCPVDCIHPTPDEAGFEQAEQMYINPAECIDCEACVEACPVDAIFAADDLPERWLQYAEINIGYFENNRHRTDYPSYRQKGWDIGSGPTEAGCKIIGERLKGSGMRWVG